MRLRCADVFLSGLTFADFEIYNWNAILTFKQNIIYKI